MVAVIELVKRRHEMGISLTDLALVIGMHGSGLSRIESGNVDCRMSTLNRISAGLDSIESNRHAITKGAIVLDEMDLRNSLYAAMMPILEEKEHDGTYQGNAHHLTQKLVTAVYEGITKAGE